MAGDSKEDSRDAVGAHELLVGAAALVPNAAVCQIPAARSAWLGRPASSICVSLLPHVDRPALSTREDGDWTLGRDLVAPCVSPCSLVLYAWPPDGQGLTCMLCSSVLTFHAHRGGSCGLVTMQRSSRWASSSHVRVCKGRTNGRVVPWGSLRPLSIEGQDENGSALVDPNTNPLSQPRKKRRQKITSPGPPISLLFLSSSLLCHGTHASSRRRPSWGHAPAILVFRATPSLLSSP